MLTGTYGFFGWAWIRLVPENLITMSATSGTMLFDGDENGTFGEPGDDAKALAGGTLTIDALDTSASAEVIITAMDMLGQSGSNSYSVQYGPVMSIEITPAEETILAGEELFYTAMASDAVGNTWDVTGETLFSIDAGAGGSWLDSSYYSENPGDWTVTGDYNYLIDTALLHVELAVGPPYYTVTSPSYDQVVNIPFPVTVTAFETQIDLWEDANQDPVLATTTVVADLSETDGLWTEFLYTPSRPYPSILAGHLEFENHGLPVMHFFAGDIPNGQYEVIANLYDSSSMRYFYGFDAC